MSVFGKKASSQVTSPQFTGLQIQTSSSALPIPILYGVNRLAPNTIWTGGFVALPIYSVQGSGGFLGIGNSKHAVITGYYYAAQLIFGLAEGPCNAVGTFYSDSLAYPPTINDLIFHSGGMPPDPPPPYVPAAQALSYSGTCTCSSDNYSLGNTATTGTINFELYGRYSQTCDFNAYDADPALMLVDFLTNETYGVGVPMDSLDLTTILGEGGDGSYQTYCKAVAIGLSPVMIDQESANNIVTRWLQLTNSTAVWSGGKLKIIPYGDTPTGGEQTFTQQQPVPPLVVGAELFYPTIETGVNFVADGGVIYTSTGLPLTPVAALTTPYPVPPYEGQFNEAPAGQYAVSPTGLYTFSRFDIGAEITITYDGVAAGSYIPNVTALYDLTDDDFQGDGSEDPVTVARANPYVVPNVQRLEFSDRSNVYAATPIDVRDQNAIELYGFRLGSTITAHEICNAASAQQAAQLILQRGLAIRNTYTFKLSWEFCLLEPMDIVTLSDANLGLVKTPVRIADIEEDDDGILTFTAEEFPLGSSSASTQAIQTASSTVVTKNTVPAPVNPPKMFESPSILTGGENTLIFGASGGLDGAADPSWGGCSIYMSADGGASYSNVASLTGASYQGVATGALAAYAGANPDTVDTLSVSTADSGAQLDPSSPFAAQVMTELLVVDDEIMAYGSATLAATSSYAVTYLERGLYGSQPGAHGPGAPVLSLSGPLAQITIDPMNIGKTLFFKFSSVNTYGNEPQDLSTCVAYPKFIYGSGSFGPVAQALANGAALDFGLTSTGPSETDDYGFASDPYTRTIDLGLASA